MIGWLLRDRTTGRIVVAQSPNAPILVATSLALAGRVAVVVGRSSRPYDLAATAALTWWAGDELLRGVNPLRRLIGASTLVGIVMTFRRVGRERAHHR
jgi:hypothetical protein